MGVFRGLAGIKFSGSPNTKGFNNTNVVNSIIIKMSVNKSLIAKYFKKGILSMFIDKPKGLLDPFSCKKKIWKTTKADKIKGMRKWSIKNRVKVPWPIEKPPQSHITIWFPTSGMAEARLVITVAPQ